MSVGLHFNNEYFTSYISISIFSGEIASLIRFIINVLRNRKFYRSFLDAFKRILPLSSTLWSFGDVILDVIQTMKYYKLAYHKYSISRMYFMLSMISFIAPSIMCFFMMVCRHRGFQILYFFIGNKINSFSRPVKYLLSIFEILVGIPIYLMLSLVFCFILVPCIMFRYGKDQLLKGLDDERKMKGQ